MNKKQKINKFKLGLSLAIKTRLVWEKMILYIFKYLLLLWINIALLIKNWKKLSTFVFSQDSGPEIN